LAAVTTAQVSFGLKLGLDLFGQSEKVARAMIEDAIDVQFYGKNDLGSPTAKQIEFAMKFGKDLNKFSKRVAHAIIDEIMYDLNQKSINEQALQSGVKVRRIWDRLNRVFIISSIASDGTVYFKGGNGAKAWARNVVVVND
jgi:hypothetical protein